VLTGRAPFQADTPLDTLIQVVESQPVHPRSLNAKTPRDLETICLKCLEKSPAKRFRSARELAEELERFLAGERILSSSRRLEPARMGKWLGLGALIGAVAFAVLGAIGWPPQSLISTPVTDPETPVVGRALGGCLLGVLGAAIAVVVWDTIVLPLWLLRHTTVPLAKAALGLGLIFNGVLLAVAGNFVHDIPLTPKMVVKVPLLLKTASTLLSILGPILCLEIAPKVRSSGVLLWAVALTISALVIRANPSIDQLKFTNGTSSWGGPSVLSSTAALLRVLWEISPHSGAARPATASSLDPQTDGLLSGRNRDGLGRFLPWRCLFADAGRRRARRYGALFAYFRFLLQADPRFAGGNHVPSVSQKRQLGTSPRRAQITAVIGPHSSGR